MIVIQKSDSITPLQLIFLAMTAIGLKNHVFVVSPLVRTAGRDAWMAVLISMAIMLIWVLLLLYVHKKTKGQPLFDWLSAVIGKKMTKGIIILLSCYLLLMVSITLRETIVWMKIVFLPDTPFFLLTFLFALTCWLLAATNLRTISVINIFLLLFITLFGFFVAISNLQYKNYSLLLPLLEHGYRPIFNSLIYQLSGLAEVFIFLLLQHKVDAPLKWRHFAVTILILTLLTLGPLVGAIIEFGPTEASKQRFPPYEEWSLVSLGSFIEHLDFLSIYQWLSGAFIRIALFLVLIKEMFPAKSEQTKNKRLLFISALMIVIVPISDLTYMNWLKNYTLPATFWFFFAFSLVFSFLALLFSKKKRRSSHEV
ncbi:GerAB/ArcD/ProY family transporter [Bacillus xiapuensis]|uniref:GerAB/ArcD/ProY family transporter n=1 Tax=Bacillus xiapuensis TaxID=2014075 RepID=UPI001E2A17DE|nr:endospore germination permease [Bacillus xiapuensis]